MIGVAVVGSSVSITRKMFNAGNRWSIQSNNKQTKNAEKEWKNQSLQLALTQKG